MTRPQRTDAILATVTVALASTLGTLEDLGEHPKGCPQRNNDNPCDCGLDAAILLARNALKGVQSLAMQLGIDLSTTYKPNQTPDVSSVVCAVTPAGAGFAFQPADWSKIKYTVGGDGIQPVNGQSYLSQQPNGDLQARATVGPWETFYITGSLASINPNAATGQGAGDTFTYAVAVIG